MESTKTTKIIIALNQEELKILEDAKRIIRALRDRADEGYSCDGDDADEVLLADSTSEVLNDLSYILEDVISYCK